MYSNLGKRWLLFWDGFDPSNKAGFDRKAVFADLVRRYTEPHRAYHTLTHIEHCLDELSECRDRCVIPQIIELALWYHDAIYDTRRNDNEVLSAQLAFDTASQAGLGAEFCKLVSDHILSTAHHDNPACSDSELLIDIDLAILGQPEE